MPVLVVFLNRVATSNVWGGVANPAPHAALLGIHVASLRANPNKTSGAQRGKREKKRPYCVRSAINSNTEDSQEPQPEQAPVFLDIASKSVMLLESSAVMVSLVVPLQWQIISWFFRVFMSFITLL